MGQVLKTFSDGSRLEYDQGAFDQWCVYLTRPNLPRKAPTDEEYFTQLQEFAARYGAGHIYWDYVHIYNQTGTKPDPAVFAQIDRLTAGYPAPDNLELAIIYSVLYLAMIAEERKANTRLGKRIKRLGVHALLMEGKTPAYAANFMRNRPWREIDTMCRQRKF